MKLSTAITRFIDYFYFPFLAKFIPLRTFRYGVCGVTTIVIGWVLYYLILHYIVRMQFLDLGFIVISPHVLTLLIAFPFVNLIGFWLSKYVSFKNSPIRTGTQMAWYMLAAAISLLINYACLKLFVEAWHIYPTPSQMMASVVSATFSYLIQRYHTFRGSTE